MTDFVNGSGSADRILRAAAAQHAAEQQAQRETLEALQRALNQPTQTRRLNVSLVGVGEDGEYKVLLIALPTGERIDVPLSEIAIRQVVKQLDPPQPSDVKATG